MNKTKGVLGSVLALSVLLSPVLALAVDTVPVPNTTSTTTTPPTNVTPPTPTIPYNGPCASAAVIKEENDLEALQEKFQDKMKAAVIVRRDAFGNAFLKTDNNEREAAIKAAVEAFRATQQSIEQAIGGEQKTVLEGFKKTMEACGAGMIFQKKPDDQAKNGPVTYPSKDTTKIPNPVVKKPVTSPIKKPVKPATPVTPKAATPTVKP